MSRLLLFSFIRIGVVCNCRERSKEKVSTDAPSYLVNLCLNSRQEQLFIAEKDISTKKPGILIVSSSVCSKRRPPGPGVPVSCTRWETSDEFMRLTSPNRWDTYGYEDHDGYEKKLRVSMDHSLTLPGTLRLCKYLTILRPGG